jgi:hypothetical protein
MMLDFFCSIANVFKRYVQKNTECWVLSHYGVYTVPDTVASSFENTVPDIVEYTTGSIVRVQR